MMANELGGDRLDDAAKIKEASLLRHAGVKDDLQQEVAQFLAQIFGRPALDRVGDFVGFFKGERHDRGERLLDVPRAPANRITERGHDVDEATNVARGLHGQGQQSANGTKGLLDGQQGAPPRRSRTMFGAVQRERAIASRPLGVSTTLIVTCWPSARCEIPAGPRTEMWTNTSLPPSSLATKPNPLASSNHFTFPITETAVEGSGATRRGGRSPSLDDLCCGRSTTPAASTSITRVTCAPLAPAPTWTRSFAPAGTASWPAACNALACRNASPWPPANSTNP